MSLSRTALVESARARGALYRLLARVFAREADVALLELLRGGAVGDLLRRMDPCVGEDLSSTGEEGASLLRLATEFRRLFLGPRPPAAPLQSLWRERFPAAGSPRELSAHYRAAGIDPGEDPHFVPDHVGMVLEFLAILAERETEALEAGDGEKALRERAAAGAFFGEHVAWWVGRFAEDVAREASLPLYRAAGLLLARLIARDAGDLPGGVVPPGAGGGAGIRPEPGPSQE